MLAAEKLSMERVGDAAFGPTDRIGQLTMRNLDIADSRARLEGYVARGMIGGTTGELYVTDNAPEGALTVPFQDAAGLDAGMRVGDVVAAVYDNTVVGDVIEANPDLQVVAEFDTGEQYGMAVARNGNDVGASGVQRRGDRPAEASACTGDQRGRAILIRRRHLQPPSGGTDARRTYNCAPGQ